KVKSVRGQRQVADAFHHGEFPDQLLELLPQQGLTSRQPKLFDPQADGDAHEALDLLEREDRRTRSPLAHDGRRLREIRPATAIEIKGRFGFRKAVEAAEIAPVGHADPQVAHDAAMRIDEPAPTTHCCLGGLAAGLFVEGAPMMTGPPSCFSSTFRLKALLACAVAGVAPAIRRSAPFFSCCP